MGFGMSAFVTAPIAKFCISTYGCLSTFGIMGTVFLIVQVILSIPMKFPARRMGAPGLETPKRCCRCGG